jgi:hypothetical protein
MSSPDKEAIGLCRFSEIQHGFRLSAHRSLQVTHEIDPGNSTVGWMALCSEGPGPVDGYRLARRRKITLALQA